MRARYTPFLSNEHGWVVLDWDHMDYCRLPDDKGKSKVLEWPNRAAVEGYLNNCYIAWARWEKTGEGEVPFGWRPRRESSPYDNGLPFPHMP